jgi:beta-xylosidase
MGTLGICAGGRKVKTTMSGRVIAGVLVAVVALSAHAAEIIKPQIGEPLRDAAVTRAPDGKFYLTGTRSTREYQGNADFLWNDGVKLWSSRDLRTWKDEGLVVDLSQYSRPHNYLGFFWCLPERPLRELSTRAATSPRLQWIDGKPVITVSNCRHEVRWLSADRATGPYREARHFDKKTTGHRYVMSYGPGHGSIVQDKDGAAWLLQGMYLCKLDEQLNDIIPGSGVFLPARIQGYPNAEWCAGQFDPRAAAIFPYKDRYILTYAAFTDEAGHKRDDSFHAIADRIDGPYSEPRPLIPGGGPTVLVEGPDGPMASCSIDDQPTLVPLTVNGDQLTATGLPAPQKTTPELPPKPKMFDYAHSKPSGRYADIVEKTGRHRPVPLFDLPLRDIAICRGGDKTCYLTGTVASRKDEGGRMKDQKADFQNNDGIYLWKSPDLKTWTPLGKIWDIEKDGAAWARQYRVPGDNPVSADFCRAVTAPEIHYADNTFYIPYSINGRGTGLLKSETGKAEGPYRDLGRITAIGESPSLFVDDDGKSFWLWGKGLQRAELNAGKTAIAGPVVDQFQDIVPPKNMRSSATIDLWDVTAPSLFTATPKNGEKRYYLTFSTVTQCQGRANRDAAMAEADSLAGPWTGPMRMIPNGGQTSVVMTLDGAMFGGFSGADPSAVFRDRPGLVPMEWLRLNNIDWPRKVLGDHVTTRGPWAEVEPVLPFATRDPHIFHAPDGFYYLSFSGGGSDLLSEDLRYWRARDINGPWEDIGILYSMEEMRDDPDWPEIKSDKDKSWNNARFAWEPSMSFGHGTYWLSCWFGGHGWGKDVCWKKSIGALLKSTSGKPEGPYKFHSQWRGDFQGLFWDDDVAYGLAGQATAWKLTDDLKQADTDWTDANGRSVSRQGFLHLLPANARIMSTDCGFQLQKVGDRFLYNGLNGHSTYDGRCYLADDVRGPYRFLGYVPRLGNSVIIKNRYGKWYAAMCQPSNGDTGQNFVFPFKTNKKYRMGAPFNYEIKLDLESDNPSVWPVHDIGHLDEAVYQGGRR